LKATPTIVKSGQIRHLLFSSPDLHLAKSVFSHVRENLAESVINIGDQSYRIKASELLETRVTERSCIIRTSTPLSIRIPEKAYALYNINEKDRKPKFVYWRSNLPRYFSNYGIKQYEIQIQKFLQDG
jgi:CRISPR/Cas system endoribonuclease Cas6 (RAMP superfamily)